MRRRRDLLQFVHVDVFGDSNGHHLHLVFPRLPCVRSRQLGVPRRPAVRDDDRDVVDMRTVAVRRLEDDTVHEVQPSRRVRVAVQVGQCVDLPINNDDTDGDDDFDDHDDKII